LTLSDALGATLGVSVGAALVAASERLTDGPGPGIGIAMAIAVLVAVFGFLLAPRLRSRPTAGPERVGATR
jgi:hypothetical protein